MKLKFPEKRFRGRAIAAMGVCLAGAWMLQSCDNDDLEGQPVWLGESIYEQLQQEGNYQNMLRLIDELNYASVMSKTGSKTLFAADDEAFDEWYRTNPWGKRRYEDLSNAQKKLLLNSAMVNNAYLVELLSNVEAEPEPLEGLCMRRESAISVYDSVSRILPADMPQTRYWDEHRHKKEGIILLKDDNSQPMIHFLPRFMSMNNINGEDLSILTNGESNSIQDAWVNGKKIVERDITCKNGYIHKVDGVMLSSDNMAQIVRNHANMSQWSTLLDRFCAPYYDEQATQDYQRLYGGNDSVFVLRYFSSQNKHEQETAPDRTMVDAMLSFDPGWNHYMYTNTANKDLHYDCGALLVPTNEALTTWWNGEGKALQDEYKEWSRVPDKTLVELLNVNMVPEFVKTVPSKFQNIVNDAKVELGVKTSDIDSCFMGCNGVVYLTNKVFSPAIYSSVAFPPLVQSEGAMSVIYWGLDKLGFKPYLNSMDSYYSFFVPTNQGMLRYVDPCSYGSTTSVMYEFYYDTDRQSVGAHRYIYDVMADTVGTKIDDATASQVENRLKDLLDNLIVVGNVEDGNTYYRTKNGSTIRVENAGVEGSMTIASGLQIEQNRPVKVSKIYNKLQNGKTYVVESEVPVTSSKSVYKTLSEHPEYSRFFDLLKGGDPDSAQFNLTLAMIDNKYSCVDYNIRLFDNYHYTVWVPTNESLDALHDAGILPYWEDLDAQTDSAWGGNRDAAKVMKYKIRTRILDFLRYHIQDNAVFIGEGVVSGRYETSKLNTVNKKFYSLAVDANNGGIVVTDALNNHRNVVMTDQSLYNNMCREYLYTQKDKETAYKGNLYSSSHAVVHLIDGPLMFSESQLQPMDWTPKPAN
ncbi:MAG: fasciclin domain-containing protein [Bacteroidaceae bacterium]|nr:fasciclin domain-containing protein [Bacteroidaceae bacterium]